MSRQDLWNAGELAGRVLLGLLFVLEGFSKLGQYSGAGSYMAAFCVVAAVVFHSKFSDRNQLIHFEKDLALAGAFLVVWARGAGPFSLDALRAQRRRPIPPQRPAPTSPSGA